eukprot:CAMPEP_0115047848 /NCGR_PEP_ID=MMETSP0227-20121206/203_1 /TAXON_ID=89957 /ORGANISM="Polarella glacialis, Strain CCMP 1383" /LENGTH=42 /DNA_ID= /DNA_START= /DNA_END= /DNA_ORIENTATION=
MRKVEATTFTEAVGTPPVAQPRPANSYLPFMQIGMAVDLATE